MQINKMDQISPYEFSKFKPCSPYSSYNVHVIAFLVMLYCVILMGFMEVFIIVGKKQLVCVDLCCCQGLKVLESIDGYQIASRAPLIYDDEMIFIMIAA